MKKTLFAIGAMVAMVACSNDFVVKEAAQEAIGFDNAFVDNSTRSEFDPSFSNSKMFADFHVYGYVKGAPLFNDENTIDENDGVIVEKSGDAWRYDGTKYWIKDANYNFNAVAPVTNGNWTKEDATATQTTLSFTNNGTTDLLYATATAVGQEAGDNDPVAFTFRHTLSKVKFSFKNAYNASNSSIRVKDIKIIDAYKTGDVVLDANTTWTPIAGSNTLTLNFGNAALTEADNNATVDQNDKGLAFGYNSTIESYNELFMIPGAGAADNTDPTKKLYTIKFTVELLVSGQEITQYEHTIKTEFAPQPGKSYDLLAEIDHTNIDPETSQDAIVFTVTEITDWDNGNTQDSDDADNINDNYPIQ